MRLGYSLSDEPTKPDPVPSELSAQIFRVMNLMTERYLHEQLHSKDKIFRARLLKLEIIMFRQKTSNLLFLIAQKVFFRIHMTHFLTTLATVTKVNKSPDKLKYSFVAIERMKSNSKFLLTSLVVLINLTNYIIIPR